MTPKKLTDCPENLREAIDWLIQVRHGGDGRGLERLSGALKQLIDDAIGNAKNSLDERCKQLECPSIYWLDYSYCKKTEQSIKGLKDANEVSQNSSDDPKLLKLKSDLKKHCDEDHSLPVDAREKALKNVKSKLEEVDKLAKNLEAFTTPKECLDLITNLCTGLETFLGFDPESKGYTGQGIVYSDLDRLCDGVMGFLSGVLSNIKGHLGQHKEAINIAITSLETNKHLGKKGFDIAIGEVVKGVGRYNTLVVESNTSIKTPIRNLYSYLKPEKGELTVGLNALQVTEQPGEHVVDQAERLVETTLQKSKHFESELKRVETHVNDLNANCKTLLNNARKNVSYETKRLEELSKSGKTSMTDMERKITDTCQTLKEAIKSGITAEVEILVRDLKKKVFDILMQLKEINEKLKVYVRNLDQWMLKANALASEATAEAKFISDKRPGFEDQNAIKKIVRELSERSGVLCSYIDEAKNELKTKVKAALEQVKAMDGKLKEDLYKVKQAVEENVTGIRTAIGKLHKVVKGENPDTTVRESEKRIAEVMNEIYSKIDTIKGPKKGSSGIEGINTLMHWYTQRFKDDKFKGEVVPRWVDDIMKSDGLIKAHLGLYSAVNNKQHFGMPYNGMGSHQAGDEIQKLIRTEIARQLTEKVPHAFISITTSEDDIHKSFTAVKGGIDHFASAIERHFKSYQGDSTQHGKVAGEIIQKIESLVGVSDGSSGVGYTRTHLQFAVEYTLVALCHKASQTAKVLNNIALKSRYELGKNLNDALNVATRLEDHLDKAVNPPRTNYAAAVDTTINDVKETLEEKLPNGTGQTVTLETETTFEQYNRFVDQNKVGGEPDALEGTLPSKIKEIGTYAATGFSVEATRESLGKWSENLAKNVESLLTAFANSGKFIQDKLNTLTRDSIGKDLKQIKDNLSKLQNELESGPLQKATVFPDEAQKLQQKCIQSLHFHVDEKIKQANSDVTTEARKQYVCVVKSLLTEFSSKVKSEIKHLTVSVNNDLLMGYKGFMSKLEDRFIKGDKPLEAMKDITEGSSTDEKSPLSRAARIFNEALKLFFAKLHGQNDVASDLKKVEAPKEALRKVLAKLVQSQYFDDEFCNNLDALTDELNRFAPGKFGQPTTVLSQAFKEGFADLASVLEKAYVSRYSGETFANVLVDGNYSNMKVTKYGEKCSKVCLTVISILGLSLTMLKVNCWSLRGQQINRDVDLGKLLAAEGYHVSDRGEQNGELQDKDIMKGDQVHKRLTWPISNAATDHLTKCKPNNKTEKFDILDILRCLSNHLQQYYSVCHYATSSSTRQPSSIYEMLCWVTGLPHSPVYPRLSLTGFTDLFETSDDDANKQTEEGVISVQTFDDVSLPAHPEIVTASKLTSTLTDVCARSNAVLTAILGHGHAGGVYACDFHTNSLKLQYPTDMNTLVCRLLDVLRRLHHQLFFICQQCMYNTKLSGWRDCWYGRGVGGSQWQCNTLQCPNESADQKHNQTCDQKCDQTAGCGLKSPLQAFLEDGLQGFLPHSLSSRGSNISCSTCNRSPGLPCKTPMGFSNISQIASHRQKGVHIYMVLTDYCSGNSSPLSKLCNLLNAVLPSAPNTLDDMFTFYYHLLHKSDKRAAEHRYDAFQKAVRAANFEESSTQFDVTSMFKSVTHSDNHRNGDLYSLVQCTGDSKTATHPCGAYVKPLCLDIYGTFSSEHADKYLSWTVYLTETFYQFLKQLYEECRNNCVIPKNKCHGKGCYKECLFLTGAAFSTPTTHWPGCNSIVNCSMTLPTLCRYGLYYNSKTELNGQSGIQAKRTCEEFCKTLQNAVKENNALYMLVYKTIPQFLWDIRSKFFWLNVALWSLSLFYLLCVMVGRLDVLHIRSHLKIPSSHKITAQSLLAAAQVGRLAKISYLQP